VVEDDRTWRKVGFCQGQANGVFLNSLITTVDDVYDVHGTLDELELFTDVIVRFVQHLSLGL